MNVKNVDITISLDPKDPLDKKIIEWIEKHSPDDYSSLICEVLEKQMKNKKENNKDNKRIAYDVGQKWMCSDGTIVEITGRENLGYGMFYLDNSFSRYIDCYTNKIWNRNMGKYEDVRPERLIGEKKIKGIFNNEPHITEPLWALVAIDHKGWPALIKYGPVNWWDEMLMGDGFVDVFDAKTPEEPGLYYWHGHYKSNSNAGRAMPNGEVDDWPGEWIGKWTEEPIKE